MKRKIPKIMIIFFLIIFLLTSNVFADKPQSPVNPNLYNKAGWGIKDGNMIEKVASITYYLVTIAGTAVAVIYLLMLGVQYMTSATGEKAQIKEKLIPYVIGVVIFFGANVLIQILLKMSNWLN